MEPSETERLGIALGGGVVAVIKALGVFSCLSSKALF
jgi:hypothetical protein